MDSTGEKPGHRTSKSITIIRTPTVKQSPTYYSLLRKNFQNPTTSSNHKPRINLKKSSETSPDVFNINSSSTIEGMKGVTLEDNVHQSPTFTRIPSITGFTKGQTLRPWMLRQSGHICQDIERDADLKTIIEGPVSRKVKEGGDMHPKISGISTFKYKAFSEDNVENFVKEDLEHNHKNDMGTEKAEERTRTTCLRKEGKRNVEMEIIPQQPNIRADKLQAENKSAEIYDARKKMVFKTGLNEMNAALKVEKEHCIKCGRRQRESDLNIIRLSTDVQHKEEELVKPKKNSEEKLRSQVSEVYGIKAEEHKDNTNFKEWYKEFNGNEDKIEGQLELTKEGQLELTNEEKTSKVVAIHEEPSFESTGNTKVFTENMATLPSVDRTNHAMIRIENQQKSKVMVDAEILEVESELLKMAQIELQVANPCKSKVYTRNRSSIACQTEHRPKEVEAVTKMLKSEIKREKEHEDEDYDDDDYDDDDEEEDDDDDASFDEIEVEIELGQCSVEDAIAYVGDIREAYKDDPETFNAFLRSLRNYKQQKVSLEDTVRQVGELFVENPELIKGFHSFLVPGMYPVDTPCVEAVERNSSVKDNLSDTSCSKSLDHLQITRSSPYISPTKQTVRCLDRPINLSPAKDPISPLRYSDVCGTPVPVHGTEISLRTSPLFALEGIKHHLSKNQSPLDILRLIECQSSQESVDMSNNPVQDYKPTKRGRPLGSKNKSSKVSATEHIAMLYGTTDRKGTKRSGNSMTFGQKRKKTKQLENLDNTLLKREGISRRGRKLGSKNKRKISNEGESSSIMQVKTSGVKKKGRKPGSKNKPKVSDVAGTDTILQRGKYDEPKSMADNWPGTSVLYNLPDDERPNLHSMDMWANPRLPGMVPYPKEMILDSVSIPNVTHEWLADFAKERQLKQSVENETQQARMGKEALIYVAEVEATYRKSPDVYHRFLCLLRDTNYKAIPLDCLIVQVQELFKDNPHLIRGFAQFLPCDSQFLLRPDEEVSPLKQGMLQALRESPSKSLLQTAPILTEYGMSQSKQEALSNSMSDTVCNNHVTILGSEERHPKLENFNEHTVESWGKPPDKLGYLSPLFGESPLILPKRVNELVKQPKVIVSQDFPRQFVRQMETEPLSDSSTKSKLVHTGERSVNKVTLLGRAGRKPEMRGTMEHPVTVFPLATSISIKRGDGSYEQQTEWHRISVFRTGLRDVVASLIEPGDRVFVSGAIRYSTYKNDANETVQSTNIIADDVIRVAKPVPKASIDNYTEANA